jgi:hypothetical protein
MLVLADVGLVVIPTTCFLPNLAVLSLTNSGLAVPVAADPALHLPPTTSGAVAPCASIIEAMCMRFPSLQWLFLGGLTLFGRVGSSQDSWARISSTTLSAAEPAALDAMLGAALFDTPAVSKRTALVVEVTYLNAAVVASLSRVMPASTRFVRLDSVPDTASLLRVALPPGEYARTALKRALVHADAPTLAAGECEDVMRITVSFKILSVV